MFQMYAIVSFKDENNEMYAIPMSWLTKSKNSCYWPKQSNDAKAKILKADPPNDATWKKCPIRVKKSNFGELICF